MRAWFRCIFVGSLAVPVFIACGGSNSPLTGGNQGVQSTTGGDDSGSSLPSLGGGGSDAGIHFNEPDVYHPPAVMYGDSACKAGFYQGDFTGSYSSYLAFGIPLSVSGNVELTLNQEGTSDKQCTIMTQGEGAITESCNNIFTLSGGTITGVANKAGMIGDAAIGGFPYYCVLTGTLDCAKTVLDNGWIECTYCVGPLADGGGSCELLGGRFAGPLTANYDTSTLAFTDGTWNGAEALCSSDAGNMGSTCNDGGVGPDGSSIVDQYLALDGGYGFLGKYGGSGLWNATCLNCGDL
jgi:hypothetical protein